MPPSSSSNREVSRPKVIPLIVGRDDESRMEDARLVELILKDDAYAKGLFVDRYGPHVRGIIVRLLGHKVEIVDLVHDVFVAALRDLPKLKKPGSLKSWLTSVAVFRARKHIRSTTRRRWLRFVAPEEVPEQEAVQADEATLEALEVTYGILEQLPADERIAFGLRYLAGMEIAEGAQATNVSASTFKRRVRKAREAFEEQAVTEPALEDWVGGPR